MRCALVRFICSIWFGLGTQEKMFYVNIDLHVDLKHTHTTQRLAREIKIEMNKNDDE